MSVNEGAVAREIKQSKPFGSVAEEAVVGLIRTAEVIRRRLAGVIEPEGITAQQYNVLRILRGAGERGLPTLEIAERMIEHAPGITRMIDRLIAKKLVARERCAEDRRVVYCAIADEGQLLLARLDGPVREADRSALDAISEKDQRGLIDMLDAIRAGHAERAAVSGEPADRLQS
jgi:DNA-binding MarR family transcriptional regulator